MRVDWSRDTHEPVTVPVAGGVTLFTNGPSVESIPFHVLHEWHEGVRGVFRVRHTWDEQQIRLTGVAGRVLHRWTERETLDDDRVLHRWREISPFLTGMQSEKIQKPYSKVNKNA